MKNALQRIGFEVILVLYGSEDEIIGAMDASGSKTNTIILRIDSTLKVDF